MARNIESKVMGNDYNYIGFKLLLSKSPKEWSDQIYSDSELSKFRLDEACADQSQLFANYSELSAKASKYRDMKTAELEDEEATVELAIREDPEEYDVIPDAKGKVMESAIKSAVRLQDTVIALRMEVLTAREYAKIMNNALKGLEHRKSMIRMMGDLWEGEYHSMINIKEQVTDSFRKSRKSKSKK